MIPTEDGIIPQEDESRGQHLIAMSFPDSVADLPIDLTENLKGKMIFLLQIDFIFSVRRYKHGALLFGRKENQPREEPFVQNSSAGEDPSFDFAQNARKFHITHAVLSGQAAFSTAWWGTIQRFGFHHGSECHK